MISLCFIRHCANENNKASGLATVITSTCETKRLQRRRKVLLLTPDSDWHYKGATLVVDAESGVTVCQTAMMTVSQDCPAALWHVQRCHLGAEDLTSSSSSSISRTNTDNLISQSQTIAGGVRYGALYALAGLILLRVGLRYEEINFCYCPRL